MRRLAAVLFALGLLRVLWAESAVEVQSWRTPTPRVPTRTPTRAPTATPITVQPTPTYPPVAGRVEVSYEVFAVASIGRLSTPGIPTGRFWIRVNGGQPREMRQPAVPGKPATLADGSEFTVIGPATIEERLVRADGYSVSVTYDLGPLGIVSNARATAGFSVPGRVVAAPVSLIATRK